ncbi:hypothetical protein RUM43_006527 [Polyplax serrata]|uniref:Uncharacterized protein n=1 Tax=Polyplax serrata TaxID=468196 RepID=A0AAN8PLI8_POLSC
MLISCKCLNVSVDVSDEQSEDFVVSSLNLTEEEESDDFFKEMSWYSAAMHCPNSLTNYWGEMVLSVETPPKKPNLLPLCITCSIKTAKDQFSSILLEITLYLQIALLFFRYLVKHPKA